MNTQKLQLPPELHAVVGTETNVYFENLFLTINPRNVAFQTQCTQQGKTVFLGRDDHDRWSFIPQPQQVGTYQWNLKIFNDDGLVDQATTNLVVVPKDAALHQDVTLVCVGDSLTNTHVYPRRIRHLCLRPDAGPNLRLLGTNGPGYVPGTDDIADEGWAGWTWGCFLKRTKTQAAIDPMPYDRASPLVRVENDQPILDIPRYLQQINHGNPPDVMTFLLGTNDLFGSRLETIRQDAGNILENAITLIDAFRKHAPNTIIGVGLVTPPSASQDAFGNNYGTTEHRWTYRQKQHYLNQEYIRVFAPGNPWNVTLVPTNAALDCHHNIQVATTPVNQDNPQLITRPSNGVHPSTAGYNQIGNAFYVWLKVKLYQQMTEKA